MNIYHDSTKNIDTNLDAESFINICKDNKSILVQVKLCTINIASDAKNQNKTAEIFTLLLILYK